MSSQKPMHAIAYCLCFILVTIGQSHADDGPTGDDKKPPKGGGKGDPILTDFAGKTFEFFGEPYGFYNLYSDKDHQVNMGLIPGWVDHHNGTYIVGFGIAFHNIRTQVSLANQEGDILIRSWAGGASKNEVHASQPAQTFTVSDTHTSAMTVATEPYRPWTGRTVEINTGSLVFSVWSTPAGVLDTFNVSQPAYLNFNITVLTAPEGEVEGIIGESLSRLSKIAMAGEGNIAQSAVMTEGRKAFEGKGQTADYAVSTIFGADFVFNRYEAIQPILTTSRRLLTDSPYSMLSFPYMGTSVPIA